MRLGRTNQIPNGVERNESPHYYYRNVFRAGFGLVFKW